MPERPGLGGDSVERRHLFDFLVKKLKFRKRSKNDTKRVLKHLEQLREHLVPPVACQPVTNNSFLIFGC